MPSSSYRMRVNGMSQRAFRKAVPGSRVKKGLIKIIIPILVGTVIGTLATFILKFMGEGFNF